MWLVISGPVGVVGTRRYLDVYVPTEIFLIYTSTQSQCLYYWQQDVRFLSNNEIQHLVAFQPVMPCNCGLRLYV